MIPLFATVSLVRDTYYILRVFSVELICLSLCLSLYLIPDSVHC